MKQSKVQEVLIRALADAHKVTTLQKARDIWEERARAYSVTSSKFHATVDILNDDLVECRKEKHALAEALKAEKGKEFDIHPSEALEAKEKRQEQEIHHSIQRLYDAAGFGGCTLSAAIRRINFIRRRAEAALKYLTAVSGSWVTPEEAETFLAIFRKEMDVIRR